LKTGYPPVDIQANSMFIYFGLVLETWPPKTEANKRKTCQMRWGKGISMPGSNLRW